MLPSVGSGEFQHFSRDSRRISKHRGVHSHHLSVTTWLKVGQRKQTTQAYITLPEVKSDEEKTEIAKCLAFTRMHNALH